jgi:hypothetical protein
LRKGLPNMNLLGDFFRERFREIEPLLDVYQVILLAIEVFSLN